MSSLCLKKPIIFTVKYGTGMVFCYYKNRYYVLKNNTWTALYPAYDNVIRANFKTGVFIKQPRTAYPPFRG